MQIAPAIVTLAPTQPLNYKLEPVTLRSTISLKLQDGLRQTPSQLLIAGPLSRAAANAGFKLGTPLTFAPGLKLRPFATLPAAPVGLISGRRAAPAAIPASIAKTAQVASLLEASRGPIEEWAKTHSGFDTSLDVLGVVVATPQLWNAMIKPGPKNKLEMFFAFGQAGVWMAKVAADFIPGLHSAKPALVWTGVILKAGEQVHAIIYKPEAGGAIPQKQG